MVANNRREAIEYEFAEAAKDTLKRLKNWQDWQQYMQSCGTGHSGKAAFYLVPGGGHIPDHNPEDAELVESALSIFIRSWGRPQYRKIKNFISNSTSTAQLAQNAGVSKYLYKKEIHGLLHKVQYCIDYLESNT